jgi:hypothetical protein
VFDGDRMIDGPAGEKLRQRLASLA